MMRTATVLIFIRLIGILASIRYKANGFASIQPLRRHHGVEKPDTNVHTSVQTKLLMVTPPANVAGAGHRKLVALKHLFRHFDDISMDCFLRCAEPRAFLKSCGYTDQEINKMAEEWPALLTKDVHDHLAPHVRFLVKTLEGGTGDLLWASEEDNDLPSQDVGGDLDASERHMLRLSQLAKEVVPVSFFNLRLEKPMAPWHAYLVWQEGLPSGSILLQDNGAKLKEFLDVCKASKVEKFVDLCNSWDTTGKQHTAREILDFVGAFQEGLVPAVRSHLHTNTKCDPGQLAELLLSHGANHLEEDHHGASLLHWAAGTGNERAVKALIQASRDDGIPPEETIAYDHESKDGATPLHWAASGVTPYGVFGAGGHPEICRLLLDLAGKEITNEHTYTKNSPLEWAAWAGSLDVVRLLIEEYGADSHFCSDNGNAAHWACAGGSLPVCHYLADTCGVDFCIKNASRRWTPLDVALFYDRANVVEWLKIRFNFREDNQEKDSTLDLLERNGQKDLMNEVSEAMKKEFKESLPGDTKTK